MHKRGFLTPGVFSEARWWVGSDENKEHGSCITCLATTEGVRLLFQRRGETVDQLVEIEWTSCNYGGKRPWWRCGRCGRRVAVIYGAGQRFACRHCYELSYKCQRENPSDRATRRAFKLRERLGDPKGGIGDLGPRKPKGMHWKTYSRLMTQLNMAEDESWGVMRKLLGIE